MTARTAAGARRTVGDQRSNRGAKPRTSRAEILATALALLDSEGIAAVNLRRISRELGLTPMALYGYFDDKEDLITAMIAEAIPSFAGVIDEDAPWQDQLADVMRQIHSAFTEHPGALDLVLSREDPDLDPIREALIRVLRRAGFDAFATISFLTMLTGFAVGSIVFSRRRGDPVDEVERIRSLPPERFPYLRENGAAYARRGGTATFEHSLHSIIAAVEAAAPD